METILSIFVGISLAAACGFRVFIPFLILSIAAFSGHIELSREFQWIGTLPALLTFAVATVIELMAYYIPWVDNLLDTLSTPVTILAGIIISASMITDISPYLKWTLAIIAGGGISGAIKGLALTTRGASTLSTGGLANAMVATIEFLLSFFITLLSIILPFIACLLVLGLLIWIFKRISRRVDQTSS